MPQVDDLPSSATVPAQLRHRRHHKCLRCRNHNVRYQWIIGQCPYSGCLCIKCRMLPADDWMPQQPLTRRAQKLTDEYARRRRKHTKIKRGVNFTIELLPPTHRVSLSIHKQPEKLSQMSSSQASSVESRDTPASATELALNDLEVEKKQENGAIDDHRHLSWDSFISRQLKIEEDVRSVEINAQTSKISDPLLHSVDIFEREENKTNLEQPFAFCFSSPREARCEREGELKAQIEEEAEVKVNVPSTDMTDDTDEAILDENQIEDNRHRPSVIITTHPSAPHLRDLLAQPPLVISSSPSEASTAIATVERSGKKCYANAAVRCLRRAHGLLQTILLTAPKNNIPRLTIQCLLRDLLFENVAKDVHALKEAVEKEFKIVGDAVSAHFIAFMLNLFPNAAALYRIQVAEQRICTECAVNVDIRFENRDYITLTVPADSKVKPTNLISMLDVFLEGCIKSSDDILCKMCQRVTSANYRISMNIPLQHRFLFVQIQRIRNSSTTDCDMVVTETVNPDCIQIREFKYKVVSAVKRVPARNSGNFTGGSHEHVALIRNATNTWIEVDDEIIEENVQFPQHLQGLTMLCLQMIDANET